MIILKTSLKAMLLATIIFWSLVGVLEGASTEAFPFVFLSMIPIFICCFLAILFTVTSIFSYLEGTMTNDTIFKRYFPYYAIILFIICSFSILKFSFDSIAIAFFTTLFFTAMQSWIWYSKTFI